MVCKTLFFPRSYDMAVVGAITSVIGTGYSIIKGQQQKKAQQKQLAEQRRANQKAEETAKKQQETAQQEYNKANRKSPDANVIQQAVESENQGGTLLTGAKGVDPNKLNLGGGSTLLG